MRTTAINACFDEEAQHMGENGPCQPNVALPIHLNKPSKELDEEVRRVFDHAGAMLRSLSSAAKIVELVRDLYDEYLREHRSAVPCSRPHPRLIMKAANPTQWHVCHSKLSHAVGSPQGFTSIRCATCVRAPGSNRHVVGNERVLQERSSEPS